MQPLRDGTRRHLGKTYPTQSRQFYLKHLVCETARPNETVVLGVVK